MSLQIYMHATIKGSKHIPRGRGGLGRFFSSQSKRGRGDTRSRRERVESVRGKSRERGEYRERTKTLSVAVFKSLKAITR
jgi:hypothetical protein